MLSILEYIKKSKITDYSISKFKTIGELLDVVKSIGYIENNIAKLYFEINGIVDSKFSKHLTGLGNSYIYKYIDQQILMAIYRSDADNFLWIYTDDKDEIDGVTVFPKYSNTKRRKYVKYIKRDDAIKYISDYINGSI